MPQAYGNFPLMRIDEPPRVMTMHFARLAQHAGEAKHVQFEVLVMLH